MPSIRAQVCFRTENITGTAEPGGGRSIRKADAVALVEAINIVVMSLREHPDGYTGNASWHQALIDA